MPTEPRPRLSIVVPNYRTEAFTRLCLRSLRKYSRLDNEVIVVDNNSADGSLDYLRSLKWIKLIENKNATVGSMAHRQALDLGTAAATGEWTLLIHSDMIVLKDGWDKTLIEHAEKKGVVGFSPNIRNVDRFDPLWKRVLDRSKDLKDSVRFPNSKLMSYCFGVRTEHVRNSGYTFATGGEAVTGFYNHTIRGKHPFLILSRKDIEPLMWHGSNVTSLANNLMTDKKSIGRFARRSERLLHDPAIQKILGDESLDR